MINLSITSNIDQVILSFNTTASIIRKKTKNNLVKVGQFIKNESIKNAPYKSGQLRKDIDYKVIGDEVIIFVKGPSEKYASIVHYDKYKRGRGTILKGGRAGRLYIERAIEDNTEEIQKIFEDIQ